MKPLNYFEQITKMPNKADKFDLRLRMVKHTIRYGIKPTARVFDTTPLTVRKWLRRLNEGVEFQVLGGRIEISSSLRCSQ